MNQSSPSISIFSLTAIEYAHAVRCRLNKGYDHALLIYQEWFRTGKLTGQHPAFSNASFLFDQIISITDFSFLSTVSELHDGCTGKFLLKTCDQLEIESVLIPMQAGGTLCLSSQVGCRMGCSFCETGRMGLIRNLTVTEIVSQLHVARFILNFSVRNIVFMGMGEPFDNYDTVMQAVKIFVDTNGFNLGFSHITISTSGCVPQIYRFMNEVGPVPHLAVSLNAPTDELRNRLMPINRSYPMRILRRAMEDFCEKTKKQILVAYVVIANHNDLPIHAEQLADFLQGLNVKINIIPYNPQSRDKYKAPTQETLDYFLYFLRERGFLTLLRQTKGQKIMAACGQLGNLELKKLKKLTNRLSIIKS